MEADIDSIAQAVSEVKVAAPAPAPSAPASKGVSLMEGGREGGGRDSRLVGSGWSSRPLDETGIATVSTYPRMADTYASCSVLFFSRFCHDIVTIFRIAQGRHVSKASFKLKTGLILVLRSRSHRAR